MPSAAGASEVWRYRDAAGSVVLRAVALQLRAEFFRYVECFAQDAYAFLLDSAGEPRQLGRYSFLGGAPWLVLRALRTGGPCVDGTAELHFEYRDLEQPALPARVVIERGAPFSEAARQLRALHMPEALRAQLPWPFVGGAVGYVAYEAGRFIERLPSAVARDLELPDLCLMFVDELLVHDRETSRSWLLLTGRAASEDQALQKIERREAVWQQRLAAFDAGLAAADSGVASASLVAGDSHSQPEPELHADRSADAYRELVQRAREHILAGDAFEVCTTYRIDAPYRGDGFRLYTLLRAINPAPFACYLRLPEACLVSSSPERFLRLTHDRVVETRPIKGTRPRGTDPETDAALRAELAHSEKDRAEQIMIVDLARNDLGRVCEVDSVHVPELMHVEAHPSVFQMVSTIRGRLRADHDGFDLLAACFPPGSMTGAPKIEAMKIIDALEAHERGIYSGCVGYFDVGGGLDLSVVIRSLVLYQGRAYLGVGGAVVADSDPETEYQECVTKAQALLAALRAAGAGA